MIVELVAALKLLQPGAEYFVIDPTEDTSIVRREYVSWYGLSAN